MAPNIAMHLSRRQVLLVCPLAHGGQVMASVGQTGDCIGG